MGGVRDKGLVTMAGWPRGLDNLSPETDLPTNENGARIALRDAVNIDLDRSGKARRREGYALAVAGTGVHSAWSDDYLPWGLYVDGGTLRVFHADESSDSLVAGLADGLPLSYTRINDAVVWTNGVQSGSITLDLEALPWACPNPSSEPAVMVLASGALDAGTYQVVATFIDAHGRESGASLAVTVDVGPNGALALSGIPQPADPLAKVRVYATSGNDGVLRAAVTLPFGITNYTLSQKPQGRPLDTQYLQPMPPGQIVRHGNGRQFVARGREVLFSPALRHGLVDPRKARVGFAGRVDLMEFVGDGTDGAGLFVGDAKRTYWLAGGDPANWRQVIAYPVGAVPGMTAVTPANVWGLESSQPVPVWLARNGLLCIGLPGGQVMALKQGEAVIDQAERGALLFREGKGNRQLIAALQGAQPQGLAIRDRGVMREYRHDQ